jgi:two-component system cell cycle sensor histidine kinase/response regulator CckA
VIHNIVLNAVQAMPEGGMITLEIRNAEVDGTSGLSLPKGRYVRIDISDTGPGISPAHLPRIFDPYFTTKQKGSGLGLATSFSIVSKHNGLLTARSQLGAGSTFSIYLPASQESRDAEKPEQRGLIPGTGRILVMDDDEVVRGVAREMLVGLGYEVEVAETGEQAISKFSSAKAAGTPFDAVILDLTVRGGLGGKETIGKMAEIDPHVKAIVSSGYSADDGMSQHRGYGFCAILPKPYNIHTLSHLLHDVLHKR